ncbi:hypothetical protein GCM10008985_39050 [Halococcus dombrowskii]|uniref:Uncharacterized protein n=1 Tax=Halococcus dombrowskii TaxID=179637 RepID=A0AAV3SLL9_HALDO
MFVNRAGDKFDDDDYEQSLTDHVGILPLPVNREVAIDRV